MRSTSFHRNVHVQGVALFSAAVMLAIEEAAALLSEQGANPFRVRAYRQAASTLRRLQEPASSILKAEGIEGLEKLPARGPSPGSERSAYPASVTFWRIGWRAFASRRRRYLSSRPLPSFSTLIASTARRPRPAGYRRSRRGASIPSAGSGCPTCMPAEPTATMRITLCFTARTP